MPPKVQSRKRARAEAAPISGINIDALLGPAPKAAKKIEPENPVPSFLRMLDSAESPAAIREAAEALATLIEKHISDSFGGNLYGKAIEELSVMREEMIEVEEPGVYNAVLRRLKEKLVKEELGGERKDFWYEVRKHRLGLVDMKASERSDVGEDEAREVSVFFPGGNSLVHRLTSGTVQLVQMIPNLSVVLCLYVYVIHGVLCEWIIRPP